MPEETFKYNADFSQIKREIDETTAKVNKLGDRLDEVGSKFGSSSPQATMVKHALDRAMAELDKKIAALEKLNNQKPGAYGSSATGKGDKSRSSADEDLERRYKRESLKYYREYQQQRRYEEAHGKEFENLFKGLAGKGGIFNPQAISSFINLITGNIGGKGGGFGGAAANIGGGMLGARALKGGAVAGATEAEVAAGTAATAGTTEAMTIGVAANVLKRPGIITAIASAAVAADFVIASRGAARGKFAAGIGGTVGGITAAQLGYDRYLDDPNNVMRSMMEARYDITSPQYRALALLGINPRGKKPEDLLGQTAGAVSKQLKGFGKVDEDTLLTLAHVTGMGNLGFSDEDLIRLYQGGQKNIDTVAKTARENKGKYDLPPDQVKALQDNVQWMKEWATEGETIAESSIAVGTQFAELASKELPDLLKILDDSVKQFDILSPLLNSVNKEFENLGKQLHDWVIQHLKVEPDVVSPDGSPVSFEVGGGGGFRIPGRGAPGSIRSRGVGGEIAGSKYDYPVVPGTGKLTGMIAEEANAAAKKYGVSAQLIESTMEGIRAGESGHGGRYDFNPGTPGHPELSYGPFQFNRRAGFGVQFEKDTAEERKRLGLGDLTDPRTMRLQARYLAEYLARGGSTAPWMGFHGRRGADPKWGESGYDESADPYKHSDVAKKLDKTSMNNMNHFQGNNKSYAISIHNPAGASYQVSGGMLGASYGNYGNG